MVGRGGGISVHCAFSGNTNQAGFIPLTSTNLIMPFIRYPQGSDHESKILCEKNCFSGILRAKVR